ncbi:transcriptional regulator [Edwardsiella tarda]|uniref:division control transcriptional repressor DicD n=1 Tax=Edwardsiella tarda TaxID=636 RepID=UPI00351C4079
MQRGMILTQALHRLEQRGLADAKLVNLIDQATLSLEQARRYWPDDEALLYDCLRFHGQQIDAWRRQIALDEQLSNDDKILARYPVLAEHAEQGRFPGCLFIAACIHYPHRDHPIHQLATWQKQASFDFTLQLLRENDIDDATLVAQQIELVQEGCLSRLLLSRQRQDIDIARQLAQDILHIAHCRRHDALG